MKYMINFSGWRRTKRKEDRRNRRGKTNRWRVKRKDRTIWRKERGNNRRKER